MWLWVFGLKTSWSCGRLYLLPLRWASRGRGNFSTQKHHTYGAQHKVERQPNVAYHFIPHSRHGDTPALVALRILLLETPGNRRHLGLCLFEGDAGFESRDREVVLC